jgi:drug/metabolite transporter (DMT)-like permease
MFFIIAALLLGLLSLAIAIFSFIWGYRDLFQKGKLFGIIYFLLGIAIIVSLFTVGRDLRQMVDKEIGATLHAHS